jgi:AbrB family looped-hinge helix DNA binding protein
MHTVKLSPKYQVMIPRPVREAMGLRPGQEVAVMRYRGRIELVPMRPVSEMRGMLQGIEATVDGEPDREL